MKLKNPFRKKPEDPEAKAAYDKAFREATLKRARKAGQKAGLTKPKSFFEQVGSFGEAVMKDFNFDSGSSILFDDPKPRRKRKTKKKPRRK